MQKLMSETFEDFDQPLYEDGVTDGRNNADLSVLHTENKSYMAGYRVGLKFNLKEAEIRLRVFDEHFPEAKGGEK